MSVINLNEPFATLKKLFDEGYNNTQIANMLGKSAQSVGCLLKKIGVKRLETRRFCKEEVDFIFDNFRTMGDTELAKSLTDLGFPRTLKQVEKFRKHKKLVRTASELKFIRDAHIKAGVFKCKNTQTPESRQKRSATMKAIWKREKWRAENGLTPATGLGNRKRCKKMFSDEQVLEMRSIKVGKVKKWCLSRRLKLSTVYAIRANISYRDVFDKNAVIQQNRHLACPIEFSNSTLNN